MLDRLLVPSGATWERSVQTLPVEATAGGRALQADGADVGAVLLADPAAPEPCASSWTGCGTTIRRLRTPRRMRPAPEPCRPPCRPMRRPWRRPVGRLVELGAATARGASWSSAPGGPSTRTIRRGSGEPVVATGMVRRRRRPIRRRRRGVDRPARGGVARWTALPDAAGRDARQAAALAAALRDVEPRSARTSPRSAATASARRAGSTRRSPVLAGIGAVRASRRCRCCCSAFAGAPRSLRLAALLRGPSAGETVLLRARGASAPGLGRDTAVEALVVGVPAAALGAAGAHGVLDAIDRGAASAAPLLPWVVAAAVVLAIVLVLAGAAWHEARRPVVRGSGDGRAAPGAR